MECGIAFAPTYDAMPPGELAQVVEAEGFASLFFPDHTHIPVAAASRLADGTEISPEYARTYDVFIALAAAATATTTLRLGSGICLVVQRDPIITAAEVASLDHLSGGRFEFGVGAGWNREEMRNHGTDPRTRMSLLRERVEAMQRIWTQDDASYHGQFVHFDRVASWPKPLQRPYPPVYVGGEGPTVLDRVLAFGDGWMPNFLGGETLERLPELRARAAEDDRELHVIMMGVPADAWALERCQAAGVTRAVHWLPSEKRPLVAEALERFANVVAVLHGRH